MDIKVNRLNQTDTAQAPVTIIRPPRGWVPIDLHGLWTYRELLYFLVWRDIKVRYKQTVLGVAWAIIQPLFMMIILTLFFGILAKVPSGDVPYPLFSYTALLPWTLFAGSVTRASVSLVQDANLIRKVYFPRLLLPFASILSPLVDFAISFLVLIGLMFYFGYHPAVAMLWLPLFLILELMLALGIGLWLSAINVQYRDVTHIVPFLIQLWMFASPIIYSSNFVPARFQVAYGILNPVAGIIEGFRWAILGTEPPSFILAPSVAIIIVVLVSGAFYFRRREKAFADII